MNFTQFVLYLANNVAVIWTLLLLITRFVGLVTILPGIGHGATGLRVRVPAIVALAFASMNSSQTAAMPVDFAMMAVSLIGEWFFGFMLGLIPAIIIAGVQLGAQLATNTMGLSAAQLFDPTTGTSSTDLARIQSDLVIIMFLSLGGHYTVIQAVTGLANSFTPGNFIFDLFTAKYFIDRVGEVFRTGVLVSSPVIVAILMTQFVMGIISKAVPTVNIFIVSFPLTIGIGLSLTVLALPEVLHFMAGRLSNIDNMASVIVENMTDFKPQ